ncbi:MAG: hypothetical protein OEW87_14780, partial [Flavobacteriaceae bacterium]|nr:hypothetical protein [Flavobacteriaceae bacterium]
MRIEAYYKVTFWWYVLILAMASQVLYIFSYFVVWMFFPEADKYYKVGLSVAIVIVIPLLLMLKYKRYAFDFSNNMVICHIYYFGIKMKTISIEFLEVEIDSETISFYVDQSHEEYLEIDIGLAWEE